MLSEDLAIGICYLLPSGVYEDLILGFFLRVLRANQGIYGQVPAETYLNVVEVDPDRIDSPDNRQMLAFKRSDAEAMGQLLVIKSDQSDISWQRELAEATHKAQQLCWAKDGRAPWGCQWFFCHSWVTF